MSSPILRVRCAALILFTTAPLLACGGSGSVPNDERQNYFNETSTNWAMTRGYPRATAYNPFEAELNPSSVGGLLTAWQADSAAEFVIQHGERAFTSAGDAYDLNSGAPLWSTGEAAPNLVVCKGVLFSAGGVIAGRSPATGEARDSASMEGSDDALYGPATAKDSSIYFATVDSAWQTAERAGAGRYQAYDVQAKTYRAVEAPGEDYLSLAPPALTGGQLYAPALQRTATGFQYVAFAATLDAAVPRPRAAWATVLDQDVAAELPQLGAMVINAQVFVTSADRRAVIALDQRSGAQLWRAAAASQVASLAVNFDSVYAAGTDADGQIVVQGFALDTGASRFERVLASGSVSGQLALGGAVLYLGTSEGELIAIDAASGQVLNRVALGGTVGNPIVTHGKVLTSNGQHLLALGLAADAAK